MLSIYARVDCNASAIFKGTAVSLLLCYEKCKTHARICVLCIHIDGLNGSLNTNWTNFFDFDKIFNTDYWLHWLLHLFFASSVLFTEIWICTNIRIFSASCFKLIILQKLVHFDKSDKKLFNIYFGWNGNFCSDQFQGKQGIQISNAKRVEYIEHA